jgi:hypothetical protein
MSGTTANLLRRRLFLEALEDRDTPNTYTVNALTDAGTGSGLVGDLRYCINAANANPGADTITFNLSGPATITLNGTQLPALSDTAGATTIAGPGASLLTIDANKQSRIFSISGGTAKIDGLTIANGNLASDGGGMSIFQATVTLTDCVLSNNSASNVGGGIINFGGTLTLINSVLSDNSAGDSGGGIDNFSTANLMLINSIFDHNVSKDIGGAIDNSGGTVTINNSTLSSNSAINGSAIGCSNGVVALMNSTLKGNSAANYGGGIDNFISNLSLINSTLAGNLAGIRGGGIHNVSATITLTSSTVSDNSAAISGGGIINDSGIVTVINAIAAGNHAATNPDIQGSFTQTKSLTNMSAAAAGLGVLGNYGGPTQTIPLLPGSPAIDAAGSSTDMFDQRGVPRPFGPAPDIGAFEFIPTNRTVDENSDIDDGNYTTGHLSLREAVKLANANPGPDTITFNLGGPATITLGGTQLTLTDTTGKTTITGPVATLLTIDANYKSRALQINSGVTAEIGGITVAKAVAENPRVGILNFGTLTITNSTISGNSLNVTIGGFQTTYGNSGIGNAGAGTLTVQNSTISGNFSPGAVGYGAGILNTSTGTVSVTNSTISGNTAEGAGGRGGGIANTGTGTVTVTNSTISGNIGGGAGGSGGGIANTGAGTVSMLNSIISGNFAGGAGGNGGGIANAGAGTITVTNCTIGNNSSGAAGGAAGGIANAGTMTVINSNISSNIAGGSNGGGIKNTGTLTVTSSTVAGNFAALGGGINNAGTLTLTNSTIAGNTASKGGGIWNSGILTVTNATITGNLGSSNGGGVYQSSGVVNAANTIIAGNQAKINPNLFGSLTTDDHNLINMSATAAGLGILGNYGGPTQTIPLLPGSPAIDAGGATTITMDQRGLLRVGSPDIGAFESQGFEFTTSGSGQSAKLNTQFTNPLVVSVTANNSVEPVDGGVITFTPPNSGPSAVLSASMVTISGGQASVIATADGIAGMYNVTASASGAAPAYFVLTNMGPPNAAYQNFIGGNLSILFGNQGNFIEVYGQTGAVTVRSNYTVVGTYNVTGIINVSGGTGNDTFTITVDSGAAFPSLVTVNADGGDDVVQVGSSAATPGMIPNLTLNLGEGNNQVIDKGVSITNSWNITAGAGNDTMGPLTSPVGNTLSINAGNGNNTASIFSTVGKQVIYTGGTGADNVTVGGKNSSSLAVFLGAGNDTFTFAPGTSIGTGFIDFGPGVDTYIPNGVFVGGKLTLLNLP